MYLVPHVSSLPDISGVILVNRDLSRARSLPGELEHAGLNAAGPQNTLPALCYLEYFCRSSNGMAPNCGGRRKSGGTAHIAAWERPALPKFGATLWTHDRDLSVGQTGSTRGTDDLIQEVQDKTGQTASRSPWKVNQKKKSTASTRIRICVWEKKEIIKRDAEFHPLCWWIH